MASVRAILVGLALLVAAPASAEGIVWRLENPFRLFTEPALTERHREIGDGLSTGERLSPVLSTERRLAALEPWGWAADAVGGTCWDAKSNSYAACGGLDAYINPKSHAVLVRAPGIAPVGAPCIFTLTVTAASGPPRQSIKDGPCDFDQRFEIPFPDGAELRVEAPGAPAQLATIRVRDIFIVGLGDSFGSGEGNPDRPVAFSTEREADYGLGPDKVELAGYPARVGAWDAIGDKTFLDNGPVWWSQACHRSLYSHQLRAALQLALDDPRRAVTFASFACAGAEVTYGLMLYYKGTEWAPDQPDKPQVSAAARTQCGGRTLQERKFTTTYNVAGKVPEMNDIFLLSCPRASARKIDLVLLSVGGNDIGFSSLVANAMLADEGVLRRLGGWMGRVFGREQAEADLPVLEARYKALNRALRGQLHVASTESDRVLLTGYPVMSLLEDGSSHCPSGGEGMTVFSEFALDRERAAEGERAADALDKVMRGSATTHGWSYVDGHRKVFAGHGICAGTASRGANDLRFPRKIDGQWQPFNPSEYQPYASRRRWFRTPNDAFLTGNYHVATSIMKNALSFRRAAWLQLVLASTYSGAFHPTAEGQAVIADAVVHKARAVLGKYDQ